MSAPSFHHGRCASIAGFALSKNPLRPGTLMHDSWARGWWSYQSYFLAKQQTSVAVHLTPAEAAVVAWLRERKARHAGEWAQDQVSVLLVGAGDLVGKVNHQLDHSSSLRSVAHAKAISVEPTGKRTSDSEEAVSTIVVQDNLLVL